MTSIAYGRHRRWSGIGWAERSAWGKRARRQKGAKHANITLRAQGHSCFMNLCQRYTRQFGRKLTPAERSWIREVHKAEIDATRVGWPWVKKPRVSYPELPDPPET